MKAQAGDVEVLLPEVDLTLVETDVESSTALWEWNAKVMSKSLNLHDECLRTCLKKNNGIELNTEGDSFLVCFTAASDAINWCLDVQSGLMRIEWPPELNKSGIVSSSTEINEGTTIFTGLRVRMGAHTGMATLSGSTTVATTRNQIFETDLLKVTTAWSCAVAPSPVRTLILSSV